MRTFYYYQEFWRYSNITCSGYPLNALDSIQPNGKTNLNSALMIILNGSTTEHLDMLEGGVIQRLLEEKWKTFAQRCFYRRLGLMLLHLLNISLAVFLRPTTKEPLLGGTDATSITRYCAEIGTCIGCVGFAIFQQAQEIAAQGFFGFLVNLISSPSKTAFVLSCLLILSCIPCRVIGDRSTEDILLVLAIPGSWFFLIFFAGAVRLTGPFVTMIYSMVVGDMFRFSIIYVIFLFAFTQAFYFLFKNLPNEKLDSKKRFSTFPVTWMGLFHMTLGSYEYEEFRETFYKKLSQLVFAMFMVFTPILLLNMLIAMMGNTYCEVITQSEKEWVKQWAKIVVVLERAIDQKSAKEFIETYSIKMPSNDKDGNEVRGVIVIKSKPKSKAKERKEALALWKRVGKRTAHEIRRFGSAAEVRKRYNLFRSKQPTARLQNGCVVQEWTRSEKPPGPERKREDLGEALNQLAFVNDISILSDLPKDPTNDSGNNPPQGPKDGDPNVDIGSAGLSSQAAASGSVANLEVGNTTSAIVYTGANKELNNRTLLNEATAPPIEMLVIVPQDRKLPPIDSTSNLCLLPPPNYEECVQSDKAANILLDNQASLMAERNYADYAGNQQELIYSQSEKYSMRYEGQTVQGDFDAETTQSTSFNNSILKPKLRSTRCYSFDKGDDHLPEFIKSNMAKNEHRQHRKDKSSRRRKKKKLSNKVRVGDINPKKSDESSDDQQSICVNVKTKVSTRLTRSRSRRGRNETNERHENMKKIEECSESASSDNGERNVRFSNNKKELLPLTPIKNDAYQKESKQKKVKFSFGENDNFDSNSTLQTENQDRSNAPSMPSSFAWVDP